MMITISDWTKMVAAFAIACLVAYQMTPPVKLFAQRVGKFREAVDFGSRRVGNDDVVRDRRGSKPVVNESLFSVVFGNEIESGVFNAFRRERRDADEPEGRGEKARGESHG